MRFVRVCASVCVTVALISVGVGVSAGTVLAAPLMTVTDELPSEPRAAIPAAEETGVWGTAPWSLSQEGVLTVGAGAIPVGHSVAEQPWRVWADHIVTIVFTDPAQTVFPQISSGMFRDLPALTNIENIGSIDISNVTNIAGMFHTSTQLKSLDVSNWNTSKVTNMSGLFCEATSLAQLDVSNWNTSNVTDMGGVFCRTPSLTQLDVSNWDTSNVTDMYAMFSEMSGVSNLDLSRWNTHNVRLMYAMFAGTTSLTELNVSTWDTSALRFAHNMFDHASALTELDLSSWSGGYVDTEYMFRGATSLRTLHLNPALQLRDNASLPPILTGTGYTGKWIQSDSAPPETPWVGSAAELIAHSRTPGSAGTYTWQESNSVTVSFDRNAENATGETAPSHGWDDTPLTLSDNGFTRAGHTFAGWNTHADGSGESYVSGSYLFPEGTHVLYAQWAPAAPTPEVNTVIPTAPEASGVAETAPGGTPPETTAHLPRGLARTGASGGIPALVPLSAGGLVLAGAAVIWLCRRHTHTRHLTR